MRRRQPVDDEPFCPSGERCDTRPGQTHGTCLPLIHTAPTTPRDNVCVDGELRSCRRILVNSKLVDTCLQPVDECARCRPMTVASGQTGVRNVVIDDTNVYWTVTGVDRRCSALRSTVAAGRRSSGACMAAVDEARSRWRTTTFTGWVSAERAVPVTPELRKHRRHSRGSHVSRRTVVLEVELGVRRDL